MNPMYDVVILGCGEAGIFAAYELARLHPDLKITALDQGRDIYHRSCPIVAGKVKECIHCPVCDTMCGFGGAGAFSDGKFNFTTQFGGWLTDFMDAREVMELIDYVDSHQCGPRRHHRVLLHLHPRGQGPGAPGAGL